MLSSRALSAVTSSTLTPSHEPPEEKYIMRSCPGRGVGGAGGAGGAGDAARRARGARTTSDRVMVVPPGSRVGRVRLHDENTAVEGAHLDQRAAARDVPLGDLDRTAGVLRLAVDAQ